MNSIKVRSGEDDNHDEIVTLREDVAVLKAELETICGRVTSLESKMDELRKWQHTVLGASAVVLFAIGTWGSSIVKWLIGSDGK